MPAASTCAVATSAGADICSTKKPAAPPMVSVIAVAAMSRLVLITLAFCLLLFEFVLFDMMVLSSASEHRENIFNDDEEPVRKL